MLVEIVLFDRLWRRPGQLGNSPTCPKSNTLVNLVFDYQSKLGEENAIAELYKEP